MDFGGIPEEILAEELSDYVLGEEWVNPTVKSELERLGEDILAFKPDPFIAWTDNHVITFSWALGKDLIFLPRNPK